MERRPKRRWVGWVLTGAVLWVTIVLTMVWFEESLIFFPDPYPSGNWDVDAVARGTGVGIEDCHFTATDGTKLHGWWSRPLDADPGHGPVLLWFHGNAGNLAHRADTVLLLSKIPAQVFIVGYRGYGRSEGSPDEDGLYLDARAAWRYLTDERGVAPERIVILGVSLGGAVAVDLARDVDCAGLIVQSSFTSVPEMASHHYPFVPGVLVRTRMDSVSKIAEVSCPVLVSHSPADEVVPFEHGRRLFEAARGDKEFFELSNVGHNETWLFGADAYLKKIRDFLIHCGSTG